MFKRYCLKCVNWNEFIRHYVTMGVYHYLNDTWTKWLVFCRQRFHLYSSWTIVVISGVKVYDTMTSSNGNIFRNTGPLRGIHQSQVNSPHKGQWRGALIFSLSCAWINGWVNNRDAGDLRRYRAHYDVIVMKIVFITSKSKLVQVMARSVGKLPWLEPRIVRCTKEYITDAYTNGTHMSTRLW